MIEHSKSARLGIKNSLMVVDMPYRTYTNKKIALKNAKKIMKRKLNVMQLNLKEDHQLLKIRAFN